MMAMNSEWGSGDQATFDIGWCMQCVDNVDSMVLRGSMTEASFERFLAAVLHLQSIDERNDSERVSLLQEVRDPVLMNASWRHQLATELKRREQKLALTRPAHALVSDSMALRLALKTVYWIAPPRPHPPDTPKYPGHLHERLRGRFGPLRRCLPAQTVHLGTTARGGEPGAGWCIAFESDHARRTEVTFP